MSNRILTYGNLSTFAAELKVKYAKQTALEALASKVNALEVVGGQANVLEGVKVNGTALTIAEKMVDILVATGTENGTISVNHANVAVAGLQALAYKAQVSEADLDAALKAVLDAKATGADLTALAGRVTTAEGKLTTLQGDASTEGSVKYEIANAFAALTGNDTEIKSLQALVDWVDEHAGDALEISNQITTNKNNIVELTALVGTLPESATSTNVVAYIAEAIAALGIGDYAKTTEVTAAINTALASYYTKTQIDEKVDAINDSIATKVATADFNTYKGEVTTALGTKVDTTTFNTHVSAADAEIAKKVAITDFNSYKETVTTNLAAKVNADSIYRNAFTGGLIDPDTANGTIPSTYVVNTALNTKVDKADVGVVTESEVKALLAD